jgi:3-oxoadipate enol-lactonase
MTQVLVNGIRLSYQIDGAGPPLVLGHSLALDRHLFDEAVDRLSTRWQVIRPDFRGHGRSCGPHEFYDLETMTADLIALIDHLGLERFAYAGLSMGGMIGMRMALALGNRISALVLMDTSAGVDPNRTAFEQWAEMVKDKEPNLKDINAFLALSVSRGFMDENPPCLERLRNQLKENDTMGNYYAQMAVLRRPSIEARLGDIQAPTLVVVGEVDMPTPLPCAETIASAIPNSKLLVVPGSGHLTILEDCRMVSDAIDKHLTTHMETN